MNNLSVDPFAIIDTASSNIGLVGRTSRQAVEEAHAPGQVKDFGIGAIIAAAIAAATSIGMGIWSAKRQNKYNEEMIDKQNAYNTPSAQMERYREAGINPYLAMTSGGVSAGTQDVTQEKQSEVPKEIKMQEIMAMMSLVSQMQMNKSNMEVNDANISKMAAQALLYDEQRNTELSKQNWYDENARKAAKWTDEVAPEQIGVLTRKNQLLDIDIKYLPLKYVAQIDLMNADADVKRQMIERIKTQMKVDNAQAALYYQQIAESQAKVKKIGQEIQNLKAQEKGIIKDNENKTWQGTLLQKDVDYKQALINYYKQLEDYVGEQERWFPFNSVKDVVPIPNINLK